MTTDTTKALCCLAATRAGYSCALGAGRNQAMAEQKSCGGKSILDMLWDRLLEKYAELLRWKWLVEDVGDHPGDYEDPAEKLSDSQEGFSACRGECLGLGTAIAVIVNPYNPNVDAVRAECVSRWEASQQ